MKTSILTTIAAIVITLVSPAHAGRVAQEGTDFARPISVYPNQGGYRGWGSSTDGNHLGVDFKSPVGTSVYAILDGDIVFSGEVGGFGSLSPSTSGGVIVLRHYDRFGKPFLAVYGHIYRSVQTYTVSQGRTGWVARGQQIGTLRPFKNKGVSLPHLHFGIYLGTSATTAYRGYGTGTAHVEPVQWLKNNAPVINHQPEVSTNTFIASSTKGQVTTQFYAYDSDNDTLGFETHIFDASWNYIQNSQATDAGVKIFGSGWGYTSYTGSSLGLVAGRSYQVRLRVYDTEGGRSNDQWASFVYQAPTTSTGSYSKITQFYNMYSWWLGTPTSTPYLSGGWYYQWYSSGRGAAQQAGTSLFYYYDQAWYQYQF